MKFLNEKFRNGLQVFQLYKMAEIPACYLGRGQTKLIHIILYDFYKATGETYGSLRRYINLCNPYFDSFTNGVRSLTR